MKQILIEANTDDAEWLKDTKGIELVSPAVGQLTEAIQDDSSAALELLQGLSFLRLASLQFHKASKAVE